MSHGRFHRKARTLLMTGSLALVSLAYGQAQIDEWDRPGAMAAVQSVNIDAAVYAIGDVSTLGDATTTLGKLRTLETRADWPMPAREAAIFNFTQSLADLPRDAVATGVMQHLATYQARTLVPHEDHGDSFVPLFNIRGAAAGVENGWQRSEFAGEAGALLEIDPTALVTAYLGSANRNQRSGYLDALQQAEVSDVHTVQRLTIERLGKKPELTAMLATTAAITADTTAIEQLLIHGRGAGLSSSLTQLNERLPQPEIASLLVFAIEQAPAGNAALAIAAWWPSLGHNAVIRDLMVSTLSDPALGASAALALASDPDVQTIRALQQTADGDSPAARRAQMALDLNRSGLTGGMRP